MKEAGNRSATRTVKIGTRPGKSARTSRTASRQGSRARGPARPRGKDGRPGAVARLRALAGGKVFRALILTFAFLVLGAGSGAGAKAAWSYLTHSPRLMVKEIVVRTGKRVSEREVLMLANLAEGDNILGFRLADCVKGIELHPWVKRASVMRQFPDRVVIEVEEREPVALMGLGSLYYVDADGEVFKKVLAGEPLDYPVFTGITLREVVEDKGGVDPLIRLGLDVIAAARRSRIFPAEEISEVRLDRMSGAAVVRSSDGMLVRLGRDELADKWQRLERTLLELGDETGKVAELDLNYAGRVTVKLKEGYRLASAEAGAAGGL